MGLSVGDLAEGFSGAGIERGDHILVHSSLGSLGWVDGGADAVIDALLACVGPAGTVIFPTLTGCPDDSRERPPVFDARHTRCWTGRIPETARSREGAVRSLHPTHSVAAIGKLAEWLTQGHELVRTPCGFGSPYGKLADIAGKIVLVGVSQAANTSFHHAEEIAGAPYVLLPDAVDLSLIDSSGHEVEMRGTYLHRWGPRRDYDSFELAMIDYGICRTGQVGDAQVRVLDAMLMRMLLVRKLLDDPLATLALGEREHWIGRVRSGN